MRNIDKLNKEIKTLTDKVERLNTQLSELEFQRNALVEESRGFKSYVGKYFKEISEPVTYYKIDGMKYFGDFFNDVRMTGTIITFDPGAYLTYVENFGIRSSNLIEISKEEFMEKFDKVIKMVTGKCK